MDIRPGMPINASPAPVTGAGIRREGNITAEDVSPGPVDAAEVRIPRSLKNISRYVSMDTAVQILSGESELKPLWSVTMGDDMMRTAPCVAKDGTIVSKLELEREAEEKDKPLSSPSMADDGTLFVTSSGHRLFAVRDGKKLWTLQLEQDICSMSPPVLDSSGTVYLSKFGDGKLYAAKDGKVLWDYHPGRDVSSCPLVTPDGTAVVGCEGGTLTAVKDGKELWSAPLNDTVRSTPCAGEKDRVYAGGVTGTVYCIKKGKTVWKVKTGREISSGMFAAPDGTVYCATKDNNDNYLTAIKDGKKLWDLKINGDGFYGVVYSTPCMSSDGTIFISSKDGCMYGIKDEHVVWECKTGSTIYGAPKVGPCDTVYVGNCDGKLFAFNPFESLKKMLKDPQSIKPQERDGISIETVDDWIVIGGVKLPVKGRNTEGTKE